MTNLYESGTGAVRSNDLAQERWDLLSGAACRQLMVAMDRKRYRYHPLSLVEQSIDCMQRFLGFEGEDRLELLREGWACLATAVQLLDMEEGELRNLEHRLDGREAHYPYYAMRRIATTCEEGARKYAE